MSTLYSSYKPGLGQPPGSVRLPTLDVPCTSCTWSVITCCSGSTEAVSQLRHASPACPWYRHHQSQEAADAWLATQPNRRAVTV